MKAERPPEGNGKVGRYRSGVVVGIAQVVEGKAALRLRGERQQRTPPL